MLPKYTIENRLPVGIQFQLRSHASHHRATPPTSPLLAPSAVRQPSLLHLSRMSSTLSTDDFPRSNTGGANTGGANTGGANTGGANIGGANTGGAHTGGGNTGGGNIGGGNIGGGDTGGVNTGWAHTGGANTGGVNTGGANTGGVNTGGGNTGGGNTGGGGDQPSLYAATGSSTPVAHAPEHGLPTAAAVRARLAGWSRNLATLTPFGARQTEEPIAASASSAAAGANPVLTPALFEVSSLMTYICIYR